MITTRKLSPLAFADPSRITTSTPVSTAIMAPNTLDLLYYQSDFWQRTLLFWRALHERVNNMQELERQGMPPVLDFKYETQLNTRCFDRLTNYTLLRITAVGLLMTSSVLNPITGLLISPILAMVTLSPSPISVIDSTRRLRAAPI